MRNINKTAALLAAAALIFPHFCFSQEQASASANEASQRISFYEAEASKMTSLEISKELEKQRAIQVVKNTDGAKLFAMDEDTFKGTGYAMALEKRKKSNEPEGAFYYGNHNWHLCSGLQRLDKGQLGDTVKKCWLDSFESFKIASNAQLAPASFNIARMYENGYGVMQSKLVASEWFVKAAEQFIKSNARDEALTAIEAALNLTPDHPAALRLRKSMLK
jgi:TPR repeat protein